MIDRVTTSAVRTKFRFYIYIYIYMEHVLETLIDYIIASFISAKSVFLFFGVRNVGFKYRKVVSFFRPSFLVAMPIFLRPSCQPTQVQLGPRCAVSILHFNVVVPKE